MLVYNHTFKVDNSILTSWICWIKDVYQPGVTRTGLFYNIRFFKLIEPEDDPDFSTFILQHFTDSKDKYAVFAEGDSHLYQGAMNDTWGDKLLSFGTLMQSVQ